MTSLAPYREPGIYMLLVFDEVSCDTVVIHLGQWMIRKIQLAYSPMDACRGTIV